MPPTILIVDDEADNRLLFSRILRHRGWTVLEAENGAEGCDLVLEHRPDLVLMDLSMPVMDGWKATRWLKAQSSVRHIPIVALTAHAMTGDRDKALLAGCDDYLSKPIDIPRFLTVVTRWLPIQMALR